MIVGLNDLFDIVSEVQDIAPRWWSFGLAVHLLPQVLHKIQAMVSGPDPERCLSLVLEELLKKNYSYEKYGPPSWRLILQAVGNRAGGGDRALAEKIAKNHCMAGAH